MSSSDIDKAVLDELTDIADYDIIPRPEEIINKQVRLSTDKSKIPNIRSVSHSLGKSSEKKDSRKEKSKEKKVCSKHGKKSSPTMKLYKPPVNEKSLSKRVIGQDLNTKFDSYVEQAKSTVHKNLESSKETSDESSDKVLYKTDFEQYKIMHEPAFTAQERYQILNARDNIVRGKEKISRSSKRRKIIGTCADMCPEKERYGRIAKNCLSVLETMSALDANVTSREADHRLMVKEYSRSSADQQEPLPHELRPISVLVFTMNYLLCNIIDMQLENVTLADWYDFIWNRTRSIRKDITQQQLCDIQCVDIIEKCVRFHIHCAEALSEEETSIFDPKINSENLTKCLQTLKHMYHDLQSKGIQCPNEAEFRAYDILLSLTEGETLRLVKDIRKDLLKAPQVKSAFEAALAFKSHNYVKFFKLIEKADYLSSCILHRYIFEARTRALHIIVRAYCTPHNSTMYPISNLIRDLKFEKAVEVSEFCKCHGLETDDTFIIIQRQHFTKSPAFSLPSHRSSLLVANKKGPSLAKIINNGELPKNPLTSYVPQNSFDSKGMLKENWTEIIGLKPLQEVQVMYSCDSQKVIANFSPNDKPSLMDSDSKTSYKEQSLQFKSEEELEKARTLLLKKINKLQFKSPKIKFLENKLKSVKSSQKTQSDKISSSKPKSSYSHKSVMFSDDPISQDVQISKANYQTLEKEKSLITTTSNVFHQSLPPLSTFKNSYGIKSIFETKTESQKNRFMSTNNSWPFHSSCEPVSTSFSNTSAFHPTVTTQPLLLNSDVHMLHFQNSISESFRRSDGSKPFLGLFSKDSEQVTPVTTLDQKISSSVNAEKSEGSNKNFSFSFKPTETFSSGSTFLKNTFQKNETHSSVLNESNLMSQRKEPCIIKDDSLQTQESKVREEVILDKTDSLQSFEESNDVYDVIRVQRSKEINEFAQTLVEEMCTECVTDCFVPICEEVLLEEYERAVLEDELEQIRIQLMKKTILKWRFYCERKRLRREIEKSAMCSPWQSMLLNTFCIPPGVASSLAVYKKQCSLSKNIAEKLKKKEEIAPGWEAFNPSELWSTPFLKKVSPPFVEKTGVVKYFKLCFVLPADCHSFDVASFKNWICVKFSIPQLQNQKTFSLNDGKVFISVKVIQLQPTAKYKTSMDGITAMILCVPFFADNQTYDTFLKDFEVLLNSEMLLYPYPLFTFILKCEQSENYRSVTSFLQEKLDAGYITDFNIKVISDVKSFKRNSKEILDAVAWLCQNKGIYPTLQKCNFKHYLEDSFSYAFNILYCKASLDEYNCLKWMPWYIIEFYNKVLEFRSSVLCSDLVKRISSCWPSEEFKKEYPDFRFIDLSLQERCILEMKSVSLPCFNQESNSIEDLYKYVEFVASHLTTDINMFHIRIKSILKNELSTPDWLSIINTCALYLINSLDTKFCNETDVYYTTEDLDSFENDEFWQDVMLDIRKSCLNSTKRKISSILESPSKKQRTTSEESYSMAKDSVEKNLLSSNNSKISDLIDFKTDTLVTSLKAAINKQMNESDAFLEQLNETIISGNVFRDNIDGLKEPGYIPLDEKEAEENVLTLVNTNNVHSKQQKSFTSGDQLDRSMDWLDSILSNNSLMEKSFSEISSKISELQYNIQKNNVLEEHVGKFLAKQM